MIKVYDDYKSGRIKVFLNIKNNEVTSVVVGNKAISHETGFQFYVDDYIADQLHKCEFNIEEFTPKLIVKDGEKINVPSEEIKRQREIEELESRLKQLKAE